MFGEDKIANIWLPTDVSELEEKVKARDAAAMKLEAAEIKLIKNANAARLKELKKKKNQKGGASDEEVAAGTEDPASAARRWLKNKDRPTHRLKFLIGKKVDTIEWARSEIERLNPEIEELQAKHRSGDAKRISAVFIEFVNQNEAQAAYQMVSHNLPLHMSPRYIGVDPTQVIWSNLRIMWWERIVRNFATIAFVVALIIFWAIPVAVVGAISNIDNLTNKVTFLRFILDIPDVILGVVTGLLPSVLLSVLMALLPIIIRCKYIDRQPKILLLIICQCVPNWAGRRLLLWLSFGLRTPTLGSRSFRCFWSQLSPRQRRAWLRRLFRIRLLPPIFSLRTCRGHPTSTSRTSSCKD